MNIILVNHYAGSPQMGMEFRPYYFAKEWIKQGHNVTIISASFSHLRNTQPICNIEVTDESIDGVNYLWLKTSKYEGNGVGRIINMFQFLYILRKRSKEIADKCNPNVVIGSSTYPLDIIVCKRLAKFSNAKLCYEVHDLWPLSPMELGGYSKYHPYIMLMQYAENFAYKYSDFVVSMLPKAKEHMVNHGLILEKFHTIPNGFDLSEWEVPCEIPQEHNDVLEEIHSEGKKIIGYAGGHSISNALHTFLEAAELCEQKNLVFVLVGNGIVKKDLQKLVKDRKLSNVYFLPPVSKKSIPNLLSKFDFLYIGWAPNPLYRFGISPNKLIDYLMAGKPIIHSVEAGNDLVQEANAGFSVKPNKPKEIVKAIDKLLLLDKESLNELGANGRHYALNNHDYSVLATKFANIFKE
jgi:glycosyltransferase involved in cell wall biosynthesis